MRGPGVAIGGTVLVLAGFLAAASWAGSATAPASPPPAREQKAAADEKGERALLAAIAQTEDELLGQRKVLQDLRTSLQPGAEGAALEKRREEATRARIAVVRLRIRALSMRAETERCALKTQAHEEELSQFRKEVMELAGTSGLAEFAATCRQVSLLQAILERLRERITKLKAAHDLLRRYNRELNRQAATLKAKGHSGTVVRELAGRIDPTAEELGFLYQRLEQAKAREGLLAKELVVAKDRVTLGEEGLKDAATDGLPPLPDPSQVAPVQDTQVEAARRARLSERAEKHVAVNRKHLELARELYVNKGEAIESLELEAGNPACPAAKRRVLMKEAGASRETQRHLRRWIRYLDQRSKEMELYAEMARHQAERAEEAARQERTRRRLWEVARWVSIAVILSAAVLSARKVNAVLDERGPSGTGESEDPERLKKYRTPFFMVRRIVPPAIILLAVLLSLIHFEVFRRWGVTLLASAGVVSIVFGFAARGTFANFFAGLTLCFSQPVRIGDTILIGDNFGTVEDIGLVYTVFRVWDNRRIMIPNEEMLRKEIVNYTIVDERQWAKVPIQVDVSADPGRVREILHDVAKSSPYWNGSGDPQVWFMEMDGGGVTVWVAAWADNPGKAWQLRSDILERGVHGLTQAGIPFRHDRVQYLKAPPAQA